MTYRERKERRIERRNEWADKREQKAESSFAAVDRIADGIPMGQPILVGHHSKKRARQDQDRIHNGMQRGFEHSKMAAQHRSRAAGIQDQLDRSIYSDDRDACEQLRTRIAEREAKRERIKSINREAAKVCRVLKIKRQGNYSHNLDGDQRAGIAKVLAALCKNVEASPDEVADITSAFQHSGVIGYPSYALTNLGANIRRDQKRLTQLEHTEEQRARQDK